MLSNVCFLTSFTLSITRVAGIWPSVFIGAVQQCLTSAFSTPVDNKIIQNHGTFWNLLLVTVLKKHRVFWVILFCLSFYSAVRIADKSLYTYVLY